MLRAITAQAHADKQSQENQCKQPHLTGDKPPEARKMAETLVFTSSSYTDWGWEGVCKTGLGLYKEDTKLF